MHVNESRSINFCASTSFHLCIGVLPLFLTGSDIDTGGTRSKPKDHYFHDVCFRGKTFLNVTYFDLSEAKRMQAVPGLRRIKAGWVWKLTGSRES